MNQTCDIERSPGSEGTGSPGYNGNGLNELTNVHRPANATLKGSAAGGATHVMAWVNGTLLSSAITPYADGSWAKTGVTLNSGTNTFVAVSQGGSGGAITNTEVGYLPSSVNYTYEANGSLLSDGTCYFAHDDENQLKSVWVTNAWRSDFVNDGKMRRRERIEYAWTGSTWQTNTVVLDVYDGNLVIQERNASNVPQVTEQQCNSAVNNLQTGYLGGAMGPMLLDGAGDGLLMLGGMAAPPVWLGLIPNGIVTACEIKALINISNAAGSYNQKYCQCPSGKGAGGGSGG